MRTTGRHIGVHLMALWCLGALLARCEELPQPAAEEDVRVEDETTGTHAEGDGADEEHKVLADPDEDAANNKTLPTPPPLPTHVSHDAKPSFPFAKEGHELVYPRPGNYTRVPYVKEKVWDMVAPYLLPHGNVSETLSRIFKKPYRVLAHASTMLAAGFHPVKVSLPPTSPDPLL